eukprot:g25815.t1
MLAESPEELNAMIEVVRSFCDTWRIEINLAKSQVMEVHPRGVCRKAEGYYYGSKAIEVVKQYKYLGLTLTDTLSWDAHYERALAKARKGHVALARLFARREIPFAAKRAMWTTTTLSSLEYGAEVTTFNDTKRRQYEAIQHHALTAMLSIRRKASQGAVRALAGQISLETRFLAKKLRYRAELYLMSRDRWPRYLLSLPKPNSRVSGRTSSTWQAQCASLLEDDLTLKEQ